jgi:FkbM family methyltransferase
MGRFANTILKLKSKVSNRIFEGLYRRMGRFYIEDYPELAGTAFSRIYPTLLCHNIELISYDQQEEQIYLQKGPLLFSTSPSYPWIVREIFAQHIYFIHPKYLKARSYLVLDFGMNRGYAALYFAAQSWCSTVHGFELNEFTFDLAKKNVALNPALKEKIQLHNFGLGKRDEQLQCYYLPDRDGICTTSADFLQSYAPEELERVLEKEITIRKTSTFLQQLLSTVPADTKILLKIDVEGAEYDILEDLTHNYPGFFEQVDVIIGEAHLGLEPITNRLSPFGYTNVCQKNYNPKTRDFLFIKAESLSI